MRCDVETNEGQSRRRTESSLSLDSIHLLGQVNADPTKSTGVCKSVRDLFASSKRTLRRSTAAKTARILGKRVAISLSEFQKVN